MDWFQAFRQSEGFARYSSSRSAVTVDKNFIAVIYICVLVFLASVLTAFGSRGKERRTTVIRVTYSVFICSVILISLYGHGWQEGQITAETTYLFRSTEKIKATIGLKMNLASLNITLTGHYGANKGGVNYNERLTWLDMDELSSEFRNKLIQGLPAPLTTVVEYICVDAGGFRWGRYFREAGYYSFILLWASFAFWVITIILMCSVVFFGSIMFVISGLTMCMTILVYHLLQPGYSLMIPFDKQILSLHYGWSFWLLFTTGILTTILGILTLIFNYIKPKETATFFGLEGEFLETDDNPNNFSKSLDVHKVIDGSISPNGYSNPGFLSDYSLELSRSKWTSLPELNPNSSEASLYNMADNDSGDLSISSLDRKFSHSRFVCVSIPDDVKLFSDKETFNLPIEEPSTTHGEIVAENGEVHSLTKF